MRVESCSYAGRSRLLMLTLIVLSAGASACAMAGFGGSLQLNITDRQTRQVIVAIDAGAADARILEVDATGEVELGVGTATIDRYVLHRAKLGSGASLGYFLCAQPCADPLSAYLVAYSPDQIFVADGELELHIRVAAAAGTSEEMRRTISAATLPSLWENPRIDVRPAGR